MPRSSAEPSPAPSPTPPAPPSPTPRYSSTTTRPATSAASPPHPTAASPRPPSPSAPTPSPRSFPASPPQHRAGIPLTVGQSNQIDLALSLDSVAQQVTVEDTPSVVNTSTQQTSGLVDERQVKQLPLNGRSYDQLITLNPGIVNYTGQRSGTIGTSNSSVGNMFAISGRRPQDNLFLLNGIEYTGASLINVTPGGTSGQLLGVDAVREFNVVTDTYCASYGKRQGAQITIVTASGTNKLHGSAYEFIRNCALDARNYFDQAEIPSSSATTSAARSAAPSARTSSSSSATTRASARTSASPTSPSCPTTRRARAICPTPPTQRPAQVLRRQSAVAPARSVARRKRSRTAGQGQSHRHRLSYSIPMQHIREDFGTTRFDYNISAKDLFFAVYTVDDSTANTPTQNPLTLINESLREQVLSAQEQHVFSPHLLNTARFGFSRASFFFLGYSPVGSIPGWVAGKPIGAIVIAGSTASNGSSQITGAGANVGSNNSTTRNLFTFDDHVFWSRGRHQVEVGGWIQRLQSNDNLAQNQYGQASFASLTPSCRAP